MTNPDATDWGPHDAGPWLELEDDDADENSTDK